MTKVSIDDLKAFGKAVQRARSLKGWTLDELGAVVIPPVGKSLVSKIEKGRKDTLNSRTVGRFIAALELDESWIDKFLHGDTDDGDETQAERDADLNVDRAIRENVTEGASEELLIELANSYAEGSYKDRETAYVGLRNALAAYADMKASGAVKGNADAQYHAVLAEVTKLNDAGELEDADALLEQEERRMRAEHKDTQERAEQQAATMLRRRLDQDRLRNRPDLAAKRVIEGLRREAPAGGLFWAINGKSKEWTDDGDKAGDLFSLQVALELAKVNYERAKTKTALAAAALSTLGLCHFRLAERSPNDRHLVVARNAFEAAVKKTSKAKYPENWSARQGGFGSVLREMGGRAADPDQLRKSVVVHRAALGSDIERNTVGQAIGWESLGISLSSLGKLTGDASNLSDAVEALGTALGQRDVHADRIAWVGTQSNLAAAQYQLGAVTEDLAMLSTARQGYAKCEALEFREDAPFDWARLEWNIADLALARHNLAPDPALLTDARRHLADARAFFVEGSEYQTQRCDELLEQINQAAQG